MLLQTEMKGLYAMVNYKRVGKFISWARVNTIERQHSWNFCLFPATPTFSLLTFMVVTDDLTSVFFPKHG